MIARHTRNQVTNLSKENMVVPKRSTVMKITMMKRLKRINRMLSMKKIRILNSLRNSNLMVSIIRSIISLKEE